MPAWGMSASVGLADMTPATEGAPAPGVAMLASRGDHKHPRISATQTGTLNGSGQASVTYMRDGVAVTFASKPAVTALSISAGEAVFFDFTHAQDGQGRYTGGTLSGRRGATLPSLTPVAGILTAVITGVNSIVSALSGYALFASPAAGVEYSLIAVSPS